jgi:adenylate cyclase
MALEQIHRVQRFVQHKSELSHRPKPRFEYKGFHLLLNLDEVQNFEYPQLIQVLEKMIQRIQTQQKMTNSQGIVKLNLEDEVIEPVQKNEYH